MQLETLEGVKDRQLRYQRVDDRVADRQRSTLGICYTLPVESRHVRHREGDGETAADLRRMRRRNHSGRFQCGRRVRPSNWQPDWMRDLASSATAAG